jgi:orotate phosphoribosyltransferase
MVADEGLSAILPRIAGRKNRRRAALCSLAWSHTNGLSLAGDEPRAGGRRAPPLGAAGGGLYQGGMTTLTADEALAEFRAAGALLEGHFVLSSGLHSPVFLQKMFVFQDPARTERLCRALAAKAREAFGEIDVVASPAVGGIVPGYETARWLGAMAIFVERENGAFKLRRGFSIAPGARVLLVEDIITTGLSSRECLAALAEHPGRIVGAACLIDRSGGRAEIGIRRIALATLDIPAYPADALPSELAALPAVKPGSRALAGIPSPLVEEGKGGGPRHAQETGAA